MRLKHFGFGEGEANGLYAAFDSHHTNRVAWVDVLAAVRAVSGFRHEGAVGVLQGMFEVYDQFGAAPVTTQTAHHLFLACAASEADRTAVLTLYRQRFKFEMDRVLKENQAIVQIDGAGEKMTFGQINLQYFTEGLARCPLLVEEFENQMRGRMTANSKKKK